MSDGNAVSPDVTALECDRYDNSYGNGSHNARKSRCLHNANNDDDKQRNQDERAYVEVLNDSCADTLRNSRIVHAGIDVRAKDCIEHQSDDEGRAGGGNHGAYVIEQAGVGNSGCQVGGIRQRRELIADICAGDNHTGGQSRVNSKACTDTYESQTDGCRCGPGRTAGKTGDGAEDTANRKEQLRSKQSESVINHCRNGSCRHEGGYQETNGTKNQKSFQCVVDTVNHAGQHVGKAVAAEDTDKAGNAHGYNQRHMSVLIGFIHVQAVKHEACHGNDRDQSFNGIRKSDLFFVCH